MQRNPTMMNFWNLKTEICHMLFKSSHGTIITFYIKNPPPTGLANFQLRSLKQWVKEITRRWRNTNTYIHETIAYTYSFNKANINYYYYYSFRCLLLSTGGMDRIKKKKKSTGGMEVEIDNSWSTLLASSKNKFFLPNEV